MEAIADKADECTGCGKPHVDAITSARSISDDGANATLFKQAENFLLQVGIGEPAGMAQFDKNVEAFGQRFKVLTQDVVILWSEVGWCLEKNRTEIFSKRRHPFQEYLSVFFCVLQAFAVRDLVVELRTEEETGWHFRLPRFHLPHGR